MDLHFRRSGFVKGGVVTNASNEALNLSVLPAFLRTLLITDGTVTKALEAFYWEPVCVKKLAQAEVMATTDLPLLDALKGHRMLSREVVLTGEQSNRNYAFATSHLRLDLLSGDIREQLLEEKIGIGALLREIGLETYREVMNVGRGLYPALSTGECAECEQEMVYRTYVIYIARRPAIQITEYFLLDVYSNTGLTEQHRKSNE